MSHQSLNLPAVLRQSGHRLTPQRQIILDALCDMGGHVTVAELYERVHGSYPAIDRSTVYRALDFFGELGLVRSAEVGGAAVYEMALPGLAPAHPHLVCRDCGDVAHAPGEVFAGLRARLAADYGFAADLDGLTILGRCRECAQGVAT